MSRFIDVRQGLIAAFVAAMVLAAIPSGRAAEIDYNDVNGVAVMFFDISEDNIAGEPRFGQPVAVGNTLDFDPVGFVSQSASGESQIVDSQLTFTVMTVNPQDQILGVNISERGDFAIAGLAQDAFAYAAVAASVFWDVLEINNQPVGSPISGSGDMIFSPSDGTYNLSEDGPSADAWVGSLPVNVPPGTTKIRFTMDNTLATAAANGGSAFIAKKDGDIRIEIIVPEPGSASLALLGLLGLVASRRRRI